ncbi:class Ib ribonucleoside-diphosphate reductase assembly flavoprotein NrdI [Bacillus paranthracis]|uniref:class Ib ribonucleoside-diphosphate reductase assembly flavoprotein NrdI n=1 Tax=Bacillus paranthracis TaxID=2026186 RepID=UPI0035592566
MLVAFASKTSNVERFIKSFPDIKSVKITDNLLLEEDFIPVTYTTGFGQVPQLVEDFLTKNNKYLRGVAASGNCNWGNMFAKSADVISDKYNVPVLMKFELSETINDRKKFESTYSQIV